LVETVEAPTRDGAPALVEGAKVRVLAQDRTGADEADWTIVSEEYSYENGKLVGPELFLTDGHKYVFAAYTVINSTASSACYYDTDAEGYAVADVAADEHFFFGGTGEITVTSATGAIQLSLEHAFMRFKYSAHNSIPSQLTVSGVSLDSDHRIHVATRKSAFGTLAASASNVALPLSDTGYALGSTGGQNPFYVTVSGEIEGDAGGDLAFSDIRVAFRKTVARNRS
jgi:hypothetical protein